jgi:ribosome assembly protein YihI (activator of Der GTPase)
MLARQPEESLEELLDRLDRAIVKAEEEGQYIDEING